MGSARQFTRIVRIRQLAEDQGRRTMNLAIAELVELELALRTAKQREREGRSLVAASACSGDIADRVAGIEESRSASRKALSLAVRIRAAEETVAELRQDYLAKRTSRLQAESLAETERVREQAKKLRKDQQALDDWYLNRMHMGEDRKIS
jgi:hypothetical protein